MKRICSLILAAALAAALLAGCSSGGGGESPAPSRTPEELAALYTDAINSCGSDMVEYNPPFSTYDPDDADQTLNGLILDTLGVSVDDMQAYAISMSMMNVKAYAIALILPAEGKEQTVLDAVNAYVDSTESSFSTYLPDQHEVAQNAKVETLSDGTVLLVMCEDADTVYQSIVDTLSGSAE